MLNARVVFNKNILQAQGLGILYDHLSSTLPMPEQFDDLLRSQIVNSLSAFDKLMHDLIRIGMVKIFENLRPSTSKDLNETVAIQYLSELSAEAIPPPAVRFEEIIRDKLSKFSFQDPAKVAEGLSYIWNEGQKWQQITIGLGITDDDAKRKLKLIVTRRNAIVHEADLDPITNQKQTITKSEAVDVSDFLSIIGNRICDLVI